MDSGVRAAQEVVRRIPDNPAHWVVVGQQWVRKARLASDAGYYLNVEGCTDVALMVQADFVPALALRGLSHMNAHRFEAARQIAGKILAQDPRERIALGILSDAELELGHIDEAADAANRLMAAHPGMAADTRGSYLSWLRGDFRNAARLIRDALLARDPRDPEPAAWTFVEAATIYWHKGDYDGADALLAEALKWVPDYPSALVGRGRIALAQGQPERAIELLERSYQGRPGAESAWLVADAYRLLGDEERAREAEVRVVQQGRLGDKLTLAQFYATRGRELEEALALLEEECTSRGGIYLEDALAWTLHRLGRQQEARRTIDGALRLGTQDARLLFHAGAIHVATGDVETGRALASHALAINPSFDVTGAAEARALLQ